MPVIFTDNYACEKCGKIFEWNYFELIRQSIDSPQFIVETISHEKNLAHNCQKKSGDIYDIEVNCPYCDFDNHFTFNVKSEVLGEKGCVRNHIDASNKTPNFAFK